MEECWLCIEYEEPSTHEGIGTCCRPLEFDHDEHICCLCLAGIGRQLPTPTEELQDDEGVAPVEDEKACG